MFVKTVPPVFIMLPETFKLPMLVFKMFADNEERDELEMLFVLIEDRTESPVTFRLAVVSEKLVTNAALRVLFKFREFAVIFVIDTFDSIELLLTLKVPIVAAFRTEFDVVKFVTTVLVNSALGATKEFEM